MGVSRFLRVNREKKIKLFIIANDLNNLYFAFEIKKIGVSFNHLNELELVKIVKLNSAANEVDRENYQEPSQVYL